MKALFATDDSWAGLVLRLTLGLVLLPHGAQKLLGWFGGFGFDGTMGFFTQKMGLPWIDRLLGDGVIFAQRDPAFGRQIGEGILSPFCRQVRFGLSILGI